WSPAKDERKAEIAARGCKVWIEIECTLEFFYRLVGAPPGGGYEAEREVRPRVAIVEYRSPDGEGLCLLDLRLHCYPTELTRQQKSKGQHNMRRRILGMTLNDLLKCGDRGKALGLG